MSVMSTVRGTFLARPNEKVTLDELKQSTGAIAVTVQGCVTRLRNREGMNIKTVKRGQIWVWKTTAAKQESTSEELFEDAIFENLREADIDAVERALRVFYVLVNDHDGFIRRVAEMLVRHEVDEILK